MKLTKTNNKMKAIRITLSLWMLLIGFAAAAQDTEFWFAAPDVTHSHTSGDAPMLFVLSNPTGTPINVTIDMYGGASSGNIAHTVNVTIPANGYYQVDIHSSSGGNLVLGSSKTWVENPVGTESSATTANNLPSPTNYYEKSGTVQNYGIHIYSVDGTSKFLAYYMVNGGNQRDIFALKGKPALGTYFITPFQAGTTTSDHFYHQPYPHPKGTDQIDIVATEDGTTVSFTPTRDCNNGANNQGYTAGTLYNVTLNKGETFKLRKYTQDISSSNAYENQGTLSGTVITSNKPIAVTIAEDCITGGGGHDLAGDQLVPVDMVGTRYLIIRGNSSIGERVDFTSTIAGTTTIRIYDATSSTLGGTITLNGIGNTKNINILTYAPSSGAILVESDVAIYCYQHSGDGSELGGAIIPYMYSISQKQIDFYVTTGGVNNIFLVYKTTGAGNFTFNGVTTSITGGTVINSLPDWSYATVNVGSYAGGVLSVKNPDSPFSLGYFNGNGSSASYGYLSGFGRMALPFDTLWICGDNQAISGVCGSSPIELKTDVPLADQWIWKLDDDTISVTSYDATITANHPGMYSVTVDQNPYKMHDTCWVLQMTFDAKIEPRLPVKPAKVTVPQLFSVTRGNPILPGIRGGQWETTPDAHFITSPSDITQAHIIWTTPGRKELKLHLWAEGYGCITGGTFDERRCDTTLLYCVEVHPKHIGFFVDQHAPYYAGGGNDGRSWDSAFPTIQQALALASQGDYIWVANGTYSPRDSFPANTDSAGVYTGHYMCDYDSVRIFTGSYVMDWDSVQVFGSFGGYGDDEKIALRSYEHNLAERNLLENPTILKGSDDRNPVVKIDGSTRYTHLEIVPGDPPCRGVSRAARWDGVTIRDGQAPYGAGVLFENGASGTLSSVVIKQNRAEEAGGGVYISGASNPTPAPHWWYSGDPLLFGVEISGNRAKEGAGIYNAGSNFELVNVTVSGNLASESGGGLYNATGAPLIYNTILYGSRAAATRTADVANMGGTPTFLRSDIGGAITDKQWDSYYGTDGGGNISQNPGFAKPGFTDHGYQQEGDYRLVSQSAGAVNGGYNSYIWSNNGHGIRVIYPESIVLDDPSPRNISYADYMRKDLAGDERIIYDIVDMGAYEYYGNRPAPSLTYRVTVPEVDGAATIPPPGVYHVPANNSFTLVLKPRPNYTVRDAGIHTGSTRHDEFDGTIAIYDETERTKTFILLDVTALLDLKVSGVRDVTATEAVVEGGLRMWTDRGRLHVASDAPDALNIYTLTGQLYARRQVSAGRVTIALPAGLYIVSPDSGSRQRIAVP